MLKFLGHMFIGWIVYTDSGKQAINKLVSKAFNHIKSNALKSSELQELMSLKDIFIKDEKDESVNGTKN